MKTNSRVATLVGVIVGVTSLSTWPSWPVASALTASRLEEEANENGDQSVLHSCGKARDAARSTAQVVFAKPDSMHVRWHVSDLSEFDSTRLVVPGRHNFPEAATYRLKFTNIPGREGVELYPTLEVANTTPRTAAYLVHNAVRFLFTEEDLEQAVAGNFVTKVAYLPDSDARVETIVSTRLDPGVDPIEEADRRGSILAVVRFGKKVPEKQLPGANFDE